MNIGFANWANGATIALAVFAFVAAIFAVFNLFTLRKKYRYDILVSLTDQINTKEERGNRAKIHSAWARSNWGSNKVVGDKILSLFKDVWEAEKNRRHVSEEKIELKDAIEGTVACLNKIGYFLMERDKTLQEETPIQIWSIADDMWSKLGAFVEIRHGDRGEIWATYFKKLGQEAKHKMDLWRSKN